MSVRWETNFTLLLYQNICTKINPFRRNLLRLYSCTLTFEATKRIREQAELFVFCLFLFFLAQNPSSGIEPPPRASAGHHP
jgi:hypothetical protein